MDHDPRLGELVTLLLALAALAIVGLSGLSSLLFPRGSLTGDRLAAAVLCGGAALGIVAAVGALFLPAVDLVIPWARPITQLRFRLDAIAAMFLLSDLVIAAAGSIYAIEYWSPEHHAKNSRKARIFFGVVAAGLGLVFIAGDALVLLAGWEIMALGAFMAVTTDDADPAVRDAGRLYLFCTKAATMSLIALFAVWYGATGSFALQPLHGAPPPGLFVLAVLGFGFKAGVMPLHIWLPGAHASAPSHVSALMSGVLIKAGIYGLVRVLGLCVDAPAWWGQTIFGLGVASSVLGVVFAIGQHDLKRLLAYHSIENIGIILIGLGMALVGREAGSPGLVALGLAGALLHVWNHGLFKALLFLSAGSVIHGTGVRHIDHLGGLARRMPRTSLAFLVGAVAICGLPPLNGFVSEFLLYSGFLDALKPGGRSWLIGGVGAPALALTGALAMLCFAKVFGVAFLGEPRSDAAARARPSGPAMWGPMAGLGALCAFIGLGAVLFAPILDAAVVDWGGVGGLAHRAPLLAISVFEALLLATIAVLGAALAGRLAPTPPVVTWDCGYADPKPSMQYTASSFADPILALFAWATWPTGEAASLGKRPFPMAARFSSQVRDPALDLALLPAATLTEQGMALLHRTQPGTLRAGLLYLLVAIIVAFALF